MRPPLTLAALALAAWRAPAQPLQLSLAFDPALPALFETRPSYLSINLDSGSLFHDFPFSHAPLTALVRNLVRAAPTQFRIGGGAADGVLFTGAGGASGNCTGAFGAAITTCVSAESFDAMLAFARATGVGLVWDLNGALRQGGGSGPWNSSNAAALLAHAAAAPQRGLPLPAAFQLGNEPEDWYKRSPPLNLSGPALAADFHALRSLLAAHPPLTSAAIYGPSGCCEDRYPLLAAFAGPVRGALDALDVHAYPLPRLANNSCLPSAYTNKSAMMDIATAVAGWRALGAPLLAAGLPLILGETATSAHGGCSGLSNVFVAGFTFMLELGVLGELGVAQVNRQDVAGWSSNGGPSYYGLLGPPGWSGGGVPLGAPHPDYWTALLWKQLVGRRVLQSALGGGSGGGSSGGGGGGGGAAPAAAAAAAAAAALLAEVDAHVWCSSSSSSGGGGGLVLTYFAMGVGEGGVTLQLPPGVPPAPRTEYVLTAPGGDIYADGVLLNGVALQALDSGELQQWPLQGRRVAAGGSVTVPQWSYGFLVLEGASAPACV